MEVGRFTGRGWQCEFNVLILAREGRRRDEALSEDEVDAMSLSLLNGKEA
jgi:hypothetical protein